MGLGAVQAGCSFGRGAVGRLDRGRFAWGPARRYRYDSSPRVAHGATQIDGRLSSMAQSINNDNTRDA